MLAHERRKAGRWRLLAVGVVACCALLPVHAQGSVQSDRTEAWIDFYRTLFGFEPLRRGQYFGVLPKGTLKSIQS
jgi:hypothetical protein